MNKPTPPIATPRTDSVGGMEYNHPAFGTVQLFRTSGRAHLFRSDHPHQYYITLKIATATLHDNHGHEHIYAGKNLIEVCMTESQFARLISSMNMGAGSACTLSRVNGESIPEPLPIDKRKTHMEGIRERLEKKKFQIRDVQAKVEQWRKEKHRPTLTEMDDLIKEMQLAHANFEGNMEYYGRVMEEHLETAVEEAKSDLEAHLLQTSGRLGFTEEELAKQLEHRGDINGDDQSERPTV